MGRSTISAHSGLGLGLAIVNHLVREHSGSVKAESAGQGKSSTFTVDFPVVPSDSESEVARRGNLFSAIAEQLWKDPAHDPERPALEGSTVLLVEDGPSNQTNSSR